MLANTPKRYKLVFIVLLIVVLSFGIYLRLHNFNAEGYGDDSLLMVAEGLGYFYDYPGDPSGIQAYPPLGNIAFASTCLLSGEDFSGVENVGHYFYPSYWEHLSQPMYSAMNECHYASRTLGILGIIIFAILCILLFDNFLSLIPITIFSLSPQILYWGGRIIHTESIQWPLTFLGLIFLYLGYSTDDKKKEFRFFALSFFTLALVTSAKWSSGIFVIFAYFLYLEKNKGYIFANIGRVMEQKRFVILRSTMKLIKNSFLFGIITYVGVTLVFRLNIFNLLQTYGYWKMRYSEFVGFSFNPLKILGNLYTMFLDVLSPLEVILIPFVLYYIYIQFNKWRKEKKLTTSAKFLLYFLAIYFIAASQVLVGNPEVFRAIIFYLPFFMVFAYTIEHFTEKLKQKDLIRVLIVILFIIVYAGINIANPVPYSSTYQNSFALPFYSILSEEDANTHTHLHKAMLTGVIEWDQIKKDVDKLPLGINESIIGPRQIIQAADERYEYYILKEQIKAQYGREPTLQEQIAMNINPSGKKYKYFIGSSPEQVEGLNVTLLKEYSYQGTTYFYLYEIGEHKIQ